MSSAIADTTINKIARNDRVSVNMSTLDDSIHPRIESKRVVRNDHVVYTRSEIESTQAEVVKKKRMIRNDHVIVYK